MSYSKDRKSTRLNSSHQIISYAVFCLKKKNAMGIKSKLAPYLSTAIGASDVSLYEHMQGYQTFANQGQRIDLRVINDVQDSSGHSVFKYENPTSTTVLTQSEASVMTDVLKNYHNTSHFGCNL